MERIDGENGDTAQYVYDSDSYLKEVRTSSHQLRYQYDEAHRMTGIREDGREVEVRYDGEGRVVEVDFAGQPAYRIRYKGEDVEVWSALGTYTARVQGNFFHLTRTQ